MKQYYALILVLLILGLADWQEANRHSLAAKDPPSIYDQEFGVYSPYKNPPNGDLNLQSLCKIKSAYLVSRHGSRGPNESKRQNLEAALGKIRRNPPSRQQAIIKPLLDEDLLDQYNWGLHTVLGKHELTERGEESARRYCADLSRRPPVILAAANPRLAQAAMAWFQGYTDKCSHIGPRMPVVTQNPGVPFVDYSYEELAWQLKWLPEATAKLNKAATSAIWPDDRLTETQAKAIMDLCAFDALRLERVADFCSIFSSTLWNRYDYSHTLWKFYRYYARIDSRHAIAPTSRAILEGLDAEDGRMRALFLSDE